MQTPTRLIFTGAVAAALLIGCSRRQATIVADERTTQFVNPVSPNAQVRDKKHGAETGLAIGALAGINGALANGVATAYYFEDKATIIGLRLNIAEAAKPSLYAAWIQKENGQERMRLGNLENRSGDVSHTLRLDTDSDLRAYTKVTITLQQNEGDISYGQEVANGILKATKR